MTIGTYWYSEFPSEFYNLEYFQFKGGGFGYAEIEAELFTTIEVNHPDRIISRLKDLIKIFNEGSLYIYEGENQIIIGIKSYTLFDYDFLFIAEIEKVLKEESIKKANIENDNYKYHNFFYLFDETYQKNKFQWKSRFLQLERTNLKNHNGFNIKIRLNCHLQSDKKVCYINDLKTICKQHRIEALYYFEKSINDTSNLMIFFGNGRQGLNLQPTNDINTDLLHDDITVIMKKHNAETGYSEEIQLYSNSNPIIELMSDQNFII